MRTIMSMSPSTVAPRFASSFASDVRHYLQLTPRQLPSQYLYDALGSALFDAICELPWDGSVRDAVVAPARLLAETTKPMTPGGVLELGLRTRSEPVLGLDDGQIRQFTGNDYTGPLSKGDVWASIAWSGDITILQPDNPNLKFTVPDAGGMTLAK